MKAQPWKCAQTVERAPVPPTPASDGGAPPAAREAAFRGIREPVATDVSRWTKSITGVSALLAATFTLLAASLTQASSLPHRARQFEAQLAQEILPYWFNTTLDTARGGYLLADSLAGRGTPTDKQLVSQSRMVWGFATAHRRGLSTPQRDYLQAARLGYEFLLQYFRDPDHDGFFWKTDLDGRPTNRCKFLYGESFVVYAFVEYYRASGDPAALHHALHLYGVLQQHLHDNTHGGWIEHTEANWTPLAPGDSRNEVEVVGYRSANAHLHWMEALAELYEATRSPEVAASLQEALRINREFFYPPNPGQSCFHRQPDWSPVTNPASAGLSYGHNVEFAWLMVRAQKVLGQPPAWNHFQAHLDHALRYGTDPNLGGLYSRGADDQPATDTTKVWWGQAEMMAALADALQHQADPAQAKALEQLIDFVLQHQIDPRDGIWLDTVAANGAVLRPGKAHNWKANYHDVRGITKFIDAYPIGATDWDPGAGR